MIIALIPLRAGSKSIPQKNIKIIAGKPLCAWVIDAAYRSKIFDEIIVSTDSKKIADVIRQINKNIKIIMRPKKLATDTTTTESVMLDLAKKTDFDILFTIQATSPLLTPDDLVNAYNQFINDRLDSLLTGVRMKRFIWSADSKPLNYDPQKRPMKQYFEGSILENGAFYITKKHILEKYMCRLGGKIGIYEMGKDTDVELDTYQDWTEVEMRLKKRLKK